MTANTATVAGCLSPLAHLPFPLGEFPLSQQSHAPTRCTNSWKDDSPAASGSRLSRGRAPRAPSTAYKVAGALWAQPCSLHTGCSLQRSNASCPEVMIRTHRSPDGAEAPSQDTHLDQPGLPAGLLRKRNQINQVALCPWGWWKDCLDPHGPTPSDSPYPTCGLKWVLPTPQLREEPSSTPCHGRGSTSLRGPRGSPRAASPAQGRGGSALFLETRR